MPKDTETPDVIFEAEDLIISAVRDDGTQLDIVKGVSFSVHKGEVVALIGESGSGKTTISLVGAGILQAGSHLHIRRSATSGAQHRGAQRPMRCGPPVGSTSPIWRKARRRPSIPSIRINEQVTEVPGSAWNQVAGRGEREGAANSIGRSIFPIRRTIGETVSASGLGRSACSG